MTLEDRVNDNTKRIEAMEAHLGLAPQPPAVPPGDWSDRTPAGDSRVIHVANDGDDSNNGDRSAPVQTLMKAHSLLRDGYADQIRLRRGDTWNMGFIGWLTKGGRDPDERLVISTYGEGPRPAIVEPLGLRFKTADHVLLRGIRFLSADPRVAGLRIYGTANDLNVEDCMFDGFSDNVSFTPNQGTIGGLRFYRNQFVNAWDDEGHSQGMYLHRVDNVDIVENLFDHNGWHETAAGKADPTVFNHHVYLFEPHGFDISGNVFTRASASAIKISSDQEGGAHSGVIEKNLFLENPCAIGLNYSNKSKAEQHRYLHQRITIEDNVIQDSGAIINDQAQAYALWLFSAKSVAFRRNLIIDKQFPEGWPAIHLNNNPQADLMIADNVIHNWGMKWGKPAISRSSIEDAVHEVRNDVNLTPDAYVDASVRLAVDDIVKRAEAGTLSVPDEIVRIRKGFTRR